MPQVKRLSRDCSAANVGDSLQDEGAVIIEGLMPPERLAQLIRIMDGQGRQPLHRDRLAWGDFLRSDIEPQLNTIWAVTDFVEANGATQVVPGSKPEPPTSARLDGAHVVRRLGARRKRCGRFRV